MATYIDPNSGAAPQPGGVAMPVVEIPISGMPVDRATAPDVMDVGVLVEPKPKRRSKKVISDTSDVAEVVVSPDAEEVISDTSDAPEGTQAGDAEHESADQ